jgi:hypothetical protein
VEPHHPPGLALPIQLPDFELGESWDDNSGLGDIAMVSLLSPDKPTSGFIWGARSNYIFPTATNDILGQGKYQVIPVPPALIKFTLF